MTLMPTRSVFDDGPADAEIVLAIDAPSADDVWKGFPLSTNSGKELAQQMHHAGLLFADCKRMAVFPTQIPGGYLPNVWTSVKAQAAKLGLTALCEGYYCRSDVPEIAEAFRRRILETKAKIIVVMGDFAMWCLTGNVSISKWRGSILRFGDKIVIPTYPPAHIFRSFEERPFAIRDFQRVADIQKDLEAYLNPPAKLYAIRPTLPGVMQTLNYLHHLLDKGPLPLAVDIETIARHIACVGIAWSNTEAICIPFMAAGGQHYWNYDEELAVFMRLLDVLTHPNHQGIGQNFNYDNQHFAKHFGYLPNITFDTMIAQHVMFPGTPKALDHLSSLYKKHHVYWKDELKEYHKMPEDLDRFWLYNCEDCCTTYEVATAQQKMLDDMGFRKQFDFMYELSRNVLTTMLRGMAQNKPSRDVVTNNLLKAIGEYELLIYNVIGKELNVGSPKQMQEFFYEELGLPVQKDKKSKRPTCNATALEKLVEIQPLLKPLVELINTKRSLGVFLSTFCMMPLDSDGRMRCSFNVCGTETMRFSSSENAFGSGGNLQNIPKGDD